MVKKQTTMTTMKTTEATSAASALTGKRRKSPMPQPGDPNYKTPTQLRNARKRRRQKQQLQQPQSRQRLRTTGYQQPSIVEQKKKQKIKHDSSGDHAKSGFGTGAVPSHAADPSMKYISDPIQAPSVQNAIRFFREQQQQQQQQQSHTTMTRFQVYVGPVLGWRTVARLAVRSSSSSPSCSSTGGGSSSSDDKLLRIGLFAPKSHKIVEYTNKLSKSVASDFSSHEQPASTVHHRRIDALVSIVQKKCRQYQIKAYDEMTGTGNLRHIAVSLQRSTGKQQVVLVWNDDKKDVKNDDKSNDRARDLLIQSLVEMSQKEDEKYSRFVQQHHDKQKRQEPQPEQRPKQRRHSNKNNKEKMASSISPPLSLIYSNHNQGPVHLHSLWVHTNNSWKHANNIIDRDGTWDCQYYSSCSAHDDCLNRKEQLKSNDDGDDDETTSFLEEKLSCAISNIHPDLYLPLYFPPQVFRQANLDGFAKIISSIRHWLISSPGQDDDDDKILGRQKRTRPIIGHCLELYGGVGTIGLHLIDLVSSLESSDENPYNKKCFETSVKRLGWMSSSRTEDDTVDDTSTFSETSQVPYICPKSKIVYKSKSATQMIQTNALKNADLVIVDPPRKGLDEEVVSALCCDRKTHNAMALIYVSCGFDAFQRDYHRLISSGTWQLDHAEGHVLFPGSDAIETLACFRRRRT